MEQFKDEYGNPHVRACRKKGFQTIEAASTIASLKKQRIPASKFFVYVLGQGVKYVA